MRASIDAFRVETRRVPDPVPGSANRAKGSDRSAMCVNPRSNSSGERGIRRSPTIVPRMEGGSASGTKLPGSFRGASPRRHRSSGFAPARASAAPSRRPGSCPSATRAEGSFPLPPENGSGPQPRRTGSGGPTPHPSRNAARRLRATLAPCALPADQPANRIFRRHTNLPCPTPEPEPVSGIDVPDGYSGAYAVPPVRSETAGPAARLCPRVNSPEDPRGRARPGPRAISRGPCPRSGGRAPWSRRNRRRSRRG